MEGAWLARPPRSGYWTASVSPGCSTAAEAAGWDVAREELTVHELFEADGVWLSSSMRFARVHTLDGKGLPDAPAHEELVALSAAS